MTPDLTLLRLSSQLAAHSAARQTVITENIAHADTPGYRARDIPDFAATLSDGPGISARATRPGHIAFGADANGFEATEIAAIGAETPNGNSVSLEDQMIRGAELRQSHDLALGVYRKTMDILRTSLGQR
jgi:flagellar basal-body rod protein FlgB